MAKIAIIGLTGESIFMNLNQFPKVGETIRANSSYTEPGGKGYNQAVAASKLGAKVSFLSAVGNDTYGKECINTLNEYNIDHNIHIKENKRTSLATILTEKKGDNKVIVSPGASLDIEDVESFADKIK
ncbi:MAG TPA: PfkB family carbohydrate kinase, partial [Chitinophagaceae bacterium]|nr:PfkB family carbohydrate kinase [Chitinophagaceae bacterium]